MKDSENKIVLGKVTAVSTAGVVIEIGSSSPGILTKNTLAYFGLTISQFHLEDSVEVFISGKITNDTISLSLISTSDIKRASKSRILYHSALRDKFFSRRQPTHAENVIILEERRAELCFNSRPGGLVGVLNQLKVAKPRSFNALLDLCFQPTIPISPNDMRTLQKYMLVSSSGEVYDTVYQFIRDFLC